MDNKNSFLLGGMGGNWRGKNKGTTDFNLIECFYSIKPTCFKVDIFNNKSQYSLAAKAEALTSFQTLVDSKKYMLQLWQIYVENRQLYVTTLTTPCQISTWFGLVSEWQGKTMMWPWSRKQPPSKLKYHPFKWLILSYIAVGWKCHRDRLHYNNCCARHRADTNADRMLPTVTTHHLLLSKSGKKADILLINCPLHYKTINGLDFT